MLALAIGDFRNAAGDEQHGRMAESWNKLRAHAQDLAGTLKVKLSDENLAECLFGGAEANGGGLSLMSNVPLMLVYAADLCAALELRSEQAPENEIYDNFTRTAKAEVLSHYLQVCDQAGIGSSSDEDGAEDEDENSSSSSDDEEITEQSMLAIPDSQDSLDDGDENGLSENEEDIALDSDDDDDDDSAAAAAPWEVVPEAHEGDERGDEEEEEDIFGRISRQVSGMTVKEMRRSLIDELYDEAQLRRLGEGCAVSTLKSNPTGHCV